MIQAGLGSHAAIVTPTLPGKPVDPALCVLGIDPGLRGGVAYLGSTTLCYPLEIAGGEVDIRAFARLVRVLHPDLVVIEKSGAMPKQGVVSTFSFGKTCGRLEGAIMALGFRLELVTPQAWKRSVLAGTAKDKAAAIAYCCRAFPSVSLLRSERSKKLDDGMADALCIAEYGRRTYAAPRAVHLEGSLP